VGARQFVDTNGNFKPASDWTPEMSAAVATIEVVGKGATAAANNVVHRSRFHFKIQALEVLCKHLGLLIAKPDDAGKDVTTFILPPATRVKYT
jgi:hypothetical protein